MNFTERFRLTDDKDSDFNMNSDYERQKSSTSGRMGRRFTLNPLIFAKEERELRRQSLAQLKLSYYPKNAHRKLIFIS
uniref:KID domain-containing protein n=1 Tax=Elaeophora elaphi TaxID=1147741 RepID=A0A0R3S5T3_9BILA